MLRKMKSNLGADKSPTPFTYYQRKRAVYKYTELMLVLIVSRNVYLIEN